MDAQFVTIGHSNRSLDEFLGMLCDARVGMVIDVRAFPRSYSNPTYNIDQLPADLAGAGISYLHVPALGGRRPKQPDIAESLNGLWRVQSFHNYADYALGPAFAAALTDLVELGRERRPALMCAEAVWWRCHRRIIADHLLLDGHSVDHLMAPGRDEHAVPTPGVQKDALGRVIYPAMDAS